MGVLAAFLFVLLPPSPSLASPRSDGRTIAWLVNQARTDVGVQTLWTDRSLQSTAQWWADQLATDEVLAHNWNIASDYGGSWCWLGEDVGRGWDVYAIFDAWMNSSGHYANIVDGGYDRMGIGVSYGAEGKVYVVLDFAGGYC
jgi:uncharacterized protein YkwD